MNNKLSYVLVLSALAAGCGGDSAKGAGQQQYETIQEGSASGVTTSIAGPGETLPPLTGTNADTTTAFALDPNAMPAGQPTSTDWTTDPAGMTSAGSPIPPAAASPAPSPTTTSASPVAPPPAPARTDRRQPAPRPPAQEPRRTEPAPRPEPAEPTDTAPPTETAPPPAPPTTTTNPPTTTSTTTTSPDTEPEEPPGGADAEPDNRADGPGR